VLLPFKQGVALFIDELPENFDVVEYEKFVFERLDAEFGEEIDEIEFIF
jgi:hypothetical protein